jgi:hypothetical protein
MTKKMEYDGVEDAEYILETVMCRVNWGYAVRNALAEQLVEIYKRSREDLKKNRRLLS